MTWQIVETQTLTHEMLRDLYDNEIGAIKVPGFVSPEICDLAMRGIYERGFDYYKDVVPKIGKIGITQFEHRYSQEKKKAYFDKAQIANEARQLSFQYSGDFLSKVMDLVNDGWNGKVGIAVEKETNKEYFAGLVRIMHRALLHLDWGPFDGPEWEIGKISAQIAWNIYVQMSDIGGEIVVYRRLWEPSDEALKIPDSYGYSPDLVKDCEYVELLPAQGDLVLFNSRNFHEVKQTNGEDERVTNSSFIGLMKDSNELIFWS